MNARIGRLSNYLVATMLLVIGAVYLFKSSIMPYHLVALSKDWVDIDKNTQTVFIAFLRTISGGFITIAIAIAVLQKKFTSTKAAWVSWLILTIGLTLFSITLYGIFIIRLNTSGSPPIVIVFIGITLLLLGFIFNQKSLRS